MERMKFISISFACLALMLDIHTMAHGYEIDTHEKISKEAFDQSKLANYDTANLSLTSLNEELTTEGLKCRENTSSTKTALQWIQEGSICEDDTRTEIYFRYKNHFYDSVHDKGLGGILWPNSGFISGERAPDWAMDMGPADGQLYSFSQGRQYFYDALTKSTDAERKANLARMFRTLGNVMHIVQDMAQPQHTRNDSHVLPKSWYEVYTNDHLGTLTYTGEPVPTFATAREYFTDLAQFTNNNFVSADTNFDKAVYLGYNLPALGAAKDELVHTLPGISPEILAECNASKPCVMTFYSTCQTENRSFS